MPLIKFLGFAPDMDPRTPGIFVDCSNLRPTRRGFRPMPTPQVLYSSLPATCLGAFLAEYTDGTRRLFAGTSAHLYEGTSGGWTEIAGGTTFSGTGFWSFTMVGDKCLATNGAQALYSAGKTGPFSAAGGSPPVSPLVESSSGFAMLFEGANWHGSGFQNTNSWDNSPSDLSASGSLTDTPGIIRAARKLGRLLVAYKNRGIYVGAFTAPPVIWQWLCVAPECGVWGPGCVVDIGVYHAIIAPDDFYLFDGANPPYAIKSSDGGPNPVKEWFFQNLDGVNAANIQGRFDRSTDTVYWHFPSINASPAGTLDTWVAWNIRTGLWTKGNDTIEVPIQPYVTPSLPYTYDQFSNAYGTYDGIPGLPYDSPLFFGSNEIATGYFKLDHALYALTGPALTGSFTTGDMGDGNKYFFFDKVRPDFTTFPFPPSGIVKLTDLHREALGLTLLTGDTENLYTDGFVYIRGNDRYHQFQFDFSGADFEIIGFDPNFQEEGDR